MSFEGTVQIFLEQPDPMLCFMLALFSAWLMGFARSGLGAGGFVVSPLMVLALGPTVGVAVVAVLMLPASITSYWQHRHDASPNLVKPLLAAAVLGTGLGGLVLWWLVSQGELALVHRRLELVVAGLSLLYVILVSFRQQIASFGKNLSAPKPLGLFLTGTAIGVSQTVANSGSPLMTIYFLCYRIGKEHFVGAQATFLLVQNLIKLLPLLLLGILHLGNAGAALLLLPLTFLGSWLGQRFYKAADDKAFFALYVALLILGFIASVLLLIGRARVLGVT